MLKRSVVFRIHTSKSITCTIVYNQRRNILKTLISTQQHLGEDIFKLDNADDDKEREDLNMESVNFEDRWFKWNR